MGRDKVAVAESSLLQNYQAKSKIAAAMNAETAQDVVEMFTPNRPS